MTAVEVRPLGATVGAEICGASVEQLAKDADLGAALLDVLEQHGVLVFRGLHLPPVQQVAFCRLLGPIDYSNGNDDVDGIYRVTLDRTKNPHAAYLLGTFEWHVDGCTPDGDECPQMATVLSAKAVAQQGGETEFSSSYAAYDAFTDDERAQFQTMRVVHSLEASQRRVTADPSPRQLAAWRSRPTAEHPLVWTHRSGRRSLLVGASADYVVGMDLEEGRALLDELLQRATSPDRVYTHTWSVGDTVIWDNRGVLHRALPYAADSSREMLRTTILGDEPIQ